MANAADVSGITKALAPNLLSSTMGIVPYAPGKAPGQPGYVAPGTSSKAAPAPATASNDPQAAAYATLAEETRKQSALLAQQIAAAPKLIKYDTAGAATAALSQATAAQTPIYVDKLNNYLAKTQISRDAENRHAQETIQDAQDQLAATLDQNTTTRTRTGEDTATKIGETNYQESNYLDTSGDAADVAKRQLESANASGGLAESGVGKQALDTQQKAQSSESNQQQHAFEATKTAANLFQSRTFEDLAKSDELSKATESKTEGRTNLDLQDFLNTSNLDEAQTRTDLETQRQAAIVSDQVTREQNMADAFIQSLVNSGARPQDIALAKQIYG